MALVQPGARYANREHISDPRLKGALDDIASPLQAILDQGNFGRNGVKPPPEAPTAISVSHSGGIFTAIVTHHRPPPGVVYRLQYDTAPNFPNPIPVDLGQVQHWQQSLPGLKLYFRVATKFPASEMSSWVYFGGQVAPTQVG